MGISQSSNNRKTKGLYFLKKLLENEGAHFDPNDWHEMKFIKDIRNQIVHDGGSYLIYSEKIEETFHGPYYYKDEILSETQFYLNFDENLYKYLEKRELIRIYKKLLIFPNIDYCKYLVDFGEKILHNLFVSLNIS